MHRFRLAVTLIAAAAATACGSATPPSLTVDPTTAAATPAATTAPATTAATVIPSSAPTPSATLCIPVTTWSLARLAAETISVPVDEGDVTSLSAEAAAGSGGVVLFGSSAPSDLGQQIAHIEAETPGGVGMLVMTDEEGGDVQRMANLVGNLPWASYMGANWSAAEITSRVAAVARSMRANGITVDLSPVVDVDGRDVEPGPTDPDGWRSFSGSAAVVSADGAAYVRGLRDGGVIAVLKHFPGLGGASGNTDNGAATTLPWATLQHVGLPPFAAGIAAGAQVVMVSNAVVPGLTTGPASLSRTVIEDELVGALHFHGLVITDSLSGGAIVAAGHSLANAAVLAISAGADMVMFAPPSTQAGDLGRFQSIVDAEVHAVQTGALPLSRLQAAAAAVLTVRGIAVCG